MHFNETHLFASRLHNEVRYYLSSRVVNNFQKLCSLLVSDKLQSCLAPGTLNYVLSLEGEGCFTITITITIKNLYSACSQKVSRALRRRLYINIEQKVCFMIAPKRING